MSKNLKQELQAYIGHFILRHLKSISRTLPYYTVLLFRFSVAV